MLSKSKHHFRNKLILFFVIAIAIIVFLGTYRNFFYMNKFANEDFIQKVELNAEEKNIFFKELFLNLSNSVIALSKNRLLANSIVDDDFLRAKAVFETIIDANKNYMQLRFLDEFGIEKIRCQRDNINSKSYFVKTDKLQDKSSRYYFQLNKLLSKNQVWFSKIDLNIEYGMIDRPIKPVLRVVSPVYILGKFKGLVVINIFMKEFLEHLTKSTIFNIYLIDNNGNFLIHKNKRHNWSEYANKRYNINDEFGNLSKAIINSNKNHPMPNNKIFVKDLGVGVFKNYKLLFLQNEEMLKKNTLDSEQLGFFIGFLAILLSFPLGYILSKPFNNIYEELQQKTDELAAIAHNLEDRVEEEISKNIEKEHILMHQSKLAAMGEMIGNIAHQWRQPLTRLSLIAQNISITHEHNKMTKEFIAKTEKNILSQIEFMSNTIDDFRNFFLPDREKKLFYVNDSIKEAIKLHITSFEYNNINLSLDFSEHLSVYGYKSEFAQVVLNLLNNSKDAFIENSIENRTISIKTYMQDKSILIEFKDNAGGIKEDILAKIFEPYFSTKSDNQGTGIGLYMSKTIIEKHMNGKFYAQNIVDGIKFTIKISSSS